jgi:hypothetical protein
MLRLQVLSYVFPFTPQTSPSAGGQNGRQAFLGGEAVDVVVVKEAPFRFEVGVGLLMPCAKTLCWLEPAMENRTIPKIGRICILDKDSVEWKKNE